MTYEMEYLMHLFSCGAQGLEPKPPQKQLDWEKTASLAVDQSITYTTALPIKKYELGCPESIRSRLTASLRGASIKNAMKTDGILDLVNDFEKAGIHVLIVKGIDVARFYKNPECRVSSDADLFVKKEDEQRALDFLESYGFTMEKRPKSSNHTECYHPTLGMVELHIQLLQDMFTNSLMKNWRVDEDAFSKCKAEEFSGKKYYALETTDSLLFLTYHMIKHFLYGGMSLRMMMDNAIFAKCNLDLIDKERYKALLEESKHLHFMQAVFGIMVKYCGFSPNDFPIDVIIDDSTGESILNDLEKGGWQGMNYGVAGLDAWYYYRYKHAMNEADENELSEIKGEVQLDYIHKLFPTMTWMKRMYPKLQAKPWLYPFYLIQRLFVKGWKIITGKGRMSKRQIDKETELSESARERIELFKALDMI